MKKKLIAMVGVAALCFGMATSMFAAPVNTPPQSASNGYSSGYCGGSYSLMWDQDGNFLDQAAFEENLDSLIDSGLIREEDRDIFLERYEWCMTNGGGAAGYQGGCGRRSMGCGMYR